VADAISCLAAMSSERTLDEERICKKENTTHISLRENFGGGEDLQKGEHNSYFPQRELWMRRGSAKRRTQLIFLPQVLPSPHNCPTFCNNSHISSQAVCFFILLYSFILCVYNRVNRGKKMMPSTLGKVF